MSDETVVLVAAIGASDFVVLVAIWVELRRGRVAAEGTRAAAEGTREATEATGRGIARWLAGLGPVRAKRALGFDPRRGGPLEVVGEEGE